MAQYLLGNHTITHNIGWEKTGLEGFNRWLTFHPITRNIFWGTDNEVNALCALVYDTNTGTVKWSCP